MSVAQLKEVNGISPRTRALPATVVVPINGGAVDSKRLPIMYAPPIPLQGTRTFSPYREARRDAAEHCAALPGQHRGLRQWNKVGRLTVGQKLTIQTRGGSGRRAAARRKAKPKEAKPPKPSKDHKVKPDLLASL
jgi:hypothetical protein